MEKKEIIFFFLIAILLFITAFAIGFNLGENMTAKWIVEKGISYMKIKNITINPDVFAADLLKYKQKINLCFPS
jgi:hypothetical protein